MPGVIMASKNNAEVKQPHEHPHFIGIYFSVMMANQNWYDSRPAYAADDHPGIIDDLCSTGHI